ncbi:unnamed protein product [Chironomus riparius]|uniref:Peptidase C1A papain C-terminal domain-containing protein n=1 Tax=Chironomus riparius TaxID=315576 RepID=A0A9N9S3S5_9DIPT|nr:unnamed protein product [Chironomus riparius]
MKFVIFFVIIANCWVLSVAETDDVVQKAFNIWLAKYNRKFSDNSSFTTAYDIFSSHYKATSRQRLKFYSGESKFLMKPNKYSAADVNSKASTRGLLLDNDAEFAALVKEEAAVQGRVLPPSYPPPPASLDYRTMGYVSGVKDQGFYCSSCYAFATGCALEGQLAKKYGILPDISAQNIIDCSYNSSYGNFGCGGGNLGSSFKYIVRNPGVANETFYPYAGASQTCGYNPSMYSGTAKGYFYITGSENYLKSALAAIGPLAVGVRGDLDSFLYYGSGIYDDLMCSAIINHAMCLVGYGTDNTTSPPVDYWILKNSWSTDWGENGYMKLQIGSSLCGINTYVVYPTA